MSTTNADRSTKTRVGFRLNNLEDLLFPVEERPVFVRVREGAVERDLHVSAERRQSLAARTTRCLELSGATHSCHEPGSPAMGIQVLLRCVSKHD